ncbi:MAG: PAS domain-containing sensor histidine kinase [Bacteroidota bacterium]
MLKLHNDLLFHIEEIANLGSYQVDLKSRMWSGSDHLKRMLGLLDKDYYSLAEFYSFIHPEDREAVRTYALSCAQNKEDFQMEYRCLDEYGDIMYVNSFSKIYYDQTTEDPIQAIGIIQDITEQKQKEILLSKLNDLIERKNGTLGMIAHDILTPIAIFDLYAGIMEKELNGELLELLHKQREACNTTKAIAQDIIELSQLTQSSFILKTEQFPLNEVIRQAIKRFQHLLEVKQIKVASQLVPQLEVTWDKRKISRLIDNLLSNAIKFSETDSTISISTEMVADKIQLSVADQGIGIKEEHLPLLFDQFATSVRRKGTRGEHSTGLGLSIVKEITNMHQGDVKVESELGVGTVFTIILDPYIEDTSLNV